MPGINITTEDVTHTFCRKQSEVSSSFSPKEQKPTAESPKLLSMTMESATYQLSQPGDKVITPEFSSQIVGWLEELKNLRNSYKELTKEVAILKIKNAKTE